MRASAEALPPPYRSVDGSRRFRIADHRASAADASALLLMALDGTGDARPEGEQPERRLFAISRRRQARLAYVDQATTGWRSAIRSCDHVVALSRAEERRRAHRWLTSGRTSPTAGVASRGGDVEPDESVAAQLEAAAARILARRRRRGASRR
jgi:hypothetical protein